MNGYVRHPAIGPTFGDRLVGVAPHACAAGLAAGLGAAGLGGRPAMPWVAVAGVAALGAVVGGDGAGALLGLVVVMAIVGLVVGSARDDAGAPVPLPLPAPVAAVVVVDGPVAARPRGGWRAIASVSRAVSPGGPPPGTRLMLWLDGDAPRAGTLLGIRGTARTAIRADTPGWWRRYLRRHRVSAAVHAGTPEVLGARGGPAGVRDRAANGVRDRIAAVVPGDAGALVAGITVGSDELLSQAARSSFRDAGLAHLLAVSGQNVAVVAVCVFALAGAVGAPRGVALGGAALAVTAYGLVCQPGPSVGRATVVGLAAIAGEALSRPRLRAHVLMVALVLLLAWQPRSAEDPGLLLSFAAVAGILLFAPGVDSVLRGRVPRPVGVAVAVGVAATVATTPVVVALFGRVSLVGLAANLVALPLAGFVLATGLSGAVLDMVASPLGRPLLMMAGGGAEALRLLAGAAASVPGAAVDVPAWAAVFAAAPAAAWAGVRVGRAWRGGPGRAGTPR